MEHESTTRKPPDVGVLFVHGMGDQQRADTLVQFGEALQRWLERWLPASDGRPSVRITRAELSATAEPRPARAELRITTPSIDSTWILAESWWAESFRAPSYADLWRWSIEVVPVAVAEHFVRRFRLATWPYRKPLAWLLAGVAIAMLPLLTVVMVTSLVIGVLPIARLRTAILRVQKMLLGTVGDSYALLESSIRDAAMSFCVERDLRWLQTVAAKTVVVAHSQGAAVTHAALQASNVRPNLLFTFGSGLRKLLVLDVIRGSDRFIVWLPPLGLFLMAIGSWLGYRLVVDPTLRVDVWALQGGNLFGYVNQAVGFDIVGWRSVLTVGAAVGLAIGLVAGEGSIADRLMIAGFISLFGLFITSFVKAVMFAGPPGYVALGLVVGGGWMLGRGFAVLEGDTYTDIDKRLELDPPLLWVDVYAVSDPVPNGPLTSAAADFVDSRPVWNLASTLRDHSSYWRNTDQFVSAVALGIAAMAGIDLSATREWDEQRLLRAEARRRWRVNWLRVTRVVAVVVGVLLAQRFRQGPWQQPDDLPRLLHALFVESMELFEKIPFLKLLVSEGTKSAVVQALWPASMLLFVWLIYRLFLVAWSWWDRDDIQVLFDRKDYALFSVPFLTLLSIVGVVLAVSIALAAYVDRELMMLWARDSGIAALRADFWKGLYQPSPQGVVAAVFVALLASWLAAIPTTLAWDMWSWGRGVPDDSLTYMRQIGHGLLSFAIVAPAAWFLFDLAGDPPSTPHPALILRWAGIGAVLVLTALALLPNVLVRAIIGSSFGRRFVDRLYSGSASGPLGLWLTRTEAHAATQTESVLARRAEQMLVEWNALERKQRHVSAVSDYNREAAAIVGSGAAFLKDPDRLLAITDAFPYAALAAAEAVAIDAPALARRILEPHRQTSPGAVRRWIRRIDKHLGRVNTETQPT
jgi:hypothetical protein